MSKRQSPWLMRLPFIGSIFRQTPDSHQGPDDDRALLEDDALNIPLESNEPASDSDPGPPGIAPRSRHYSGPSCIKLGPSVLIITILAALLLAIQHPPSGSTRTNDGLLPCGGSRYSINDVRLHPLGALDNRQFLTIEAHMLPRQFSLSGGR